MVEVFKTIEGRLSRIEKIEEGVWINLTHPTEEEIADVQHLLNIETDFLKAPLDEEERSRIESDNGQTLILVDVPVIEKEGNKSIYTTIPLGIILIKHAIVTVCLKENTIIRDFVDERVKSFLTQYKTRFVLQILYRNSVRYLQFLRHIEKISNKIEKDLHRSMRNKELIQMLRLEKSLVYFSTSLKSNEVVLEKLMKYEYIKYYPEDTDLLEDVIIENKQAIEMANIYSSTLSGTMDAFASIISNNLNIVMKYLTSVTIIMAIPTMLSGFFGMNVPIPLSNNANGFWIIVAMTIVICILAILFLNRKNMF